MVPMLKKSVVQSGERTISFELMQSIFIAATVILGRPYLSCICSIFPLCKDLNAFDKSTNSSVASRFLHIYIYIITMLVVTKSFCGYVSNTHTNTHSHIHTKSPRFLAVFFRIFPIFDSFHFLNCLMIVVLQKNP